MLRGFFHRLSAFIKCRPIGLHDVAVFLGVYSLVFLQMENFANDPGVGWHIKTGEFIVTHLKIPYLDPFLHSVFSREWISDQWLSDLFLYLLHQLGSWPLIYAVLMLIYLSLYFVVLYQPLARITKSFIFSSIAIIFAFKLGQIHFILRPVMFGFVFFSITYVTLYTVLESLDRSRESLFNKLLLLPIVFIFWANLHPSFSLGLFLWGLFLAVQVFLAVVRQRKLIFFGQQVGMFGVSGFFTLINPYGAKLHQSILQLGQSDYFMNFHMEWLPPAFVSPEMTYFIVLSTIFVIGILFGDHKTRKIQLLDIVLMIVFGSLFLRSVRFAPYFGIVALFPIVHVLQDLTSIKLFRKPSWLRARLVNLETREKGSYLGLLSISVIVVIYLCGVLFGKGILGFEGQYGPRSDKFPYQAIQSLIKDVGEGETRVVFASPSFGGFLTLKGAGKLQPIVDDRNTLLGEDFYKEYFFSMESKDSFCRFVKKMTVDLIMVRSLSDLSRKDELLKHFSTVYTDSLVQVYDANTGCKE